MRLKHFKFDLFLKACVIYVLCYNFYAIYYTFNKGYLPYPFYLDKADSFMDYFNINYASLNGGAYTKDKVFYSPLILVYAKYFTSQNCLAVSNAFDLRACDILGFVTYISVCFVLSWYFLDKCMNTVSSKRWWIVLLLFSFPAMYGVERGNYIFLALVLLSIYASNSLHDKRSYLLPVILCVKYYLGVMLISFYISKKYIKLIVIIFAAAALNYIFAIMYGDDGWVYIPKYIFTFAKANKDWVDSIWAPTTLTALIALPKENDLLRVFSQVFSTLLRLVLVFRALYFFSQFRLSGKHSDMHLILVSLLFLEVFSASPGYYSLVLLFPFFCYLLEYELLTKTEKTLFVLCILPYPVQLFHVRTQLSTTFSLAINYLMMSKSECSR